MAAYRRRKGLQKGRELEGRMGRGHSRWNNSMCKNMEYLGKTGKARWGGRRKSVVGVRLKKEA